jgi:indole-3-glycerol phosphate synthase
MDKLSEIIAWKRREIEPFIRPIRERELSRLAESQSQRSKFSHALKDSDSLSVIAEIKRRSPSSGNIVQAVNAAEQARKYYNADADALSVLTDKKYFGGNLEDLWEVTDFMGSRDDPRPCLRKDFMIHPLQIVQAAEAGASAVLLIVSVLNDEEIKRLYDCANIAGVESIFEVHTEWDLERVLKANAKMIGVNNRDLSSFIIDLSFSERLIPQIPDGVIAISESGIVTLEDAMRVREAGADAVLIGEALMKKDSPDQFIKGLHTI